jgi:hypothetical protein
MPGLGIDLNLEPPESDQIYPVQWDDIEEFDGPAHEIEYDMVWEIMDSSFFWCIVGIQDQGADAADGDEDDAADGGTEGVQADATDGLQGASTDGGWFHSTYA